MDNPWLQLRRDSDQFVLEQDRDCVRRHNQSADYQTMFATESIPEPFIGRPETATVVFLGKNPGHATGAEIEYRKNPALCDAMFANLKHELREHPFYPLNPAFANTGAGKWWRERSRELQWELRGDLNKLSERMMVIEWFPYHSMRFKRPKGECPSQSYSFHLARQMINRGVLVVGMRARSLWENVDERIATAQFPFLRNPQCGHISAGNSDGDLFRRIVNALNE